MFTLSPLSAKDPVGQHLGLGSAELIHVPKLSTAFAPVSESTHGWDKWSSQGFSPCFPHLLFFWAKSSGNSGEIDSKS